jgi:hypothetical protein
MPSWSAFPLKILYSATLKLVYIRMYHHIGGTCLNILGYVITT